MKQEEIKVMLTEIDKIDKLIFYVDENECPGGISVNLNDPDGQNDLKKVFSVLLKRLETEKIKLDLKVSDGYSKGLFKEVSSEYIRDLNDELEAVFNRLQEELS